MKAMLQIFLICWLPAGPATGQAPQKQVTQHTYTWVSINSNFSLMVIGLSWPIFTLEKMISSLPTLLFSAGSVLATAGRSNYKWPPVMPIDCRHLHPRAPATGQMNIVSFSKCSSLPGITKPLPFSACAMNNAGNPLWKMELKQVVPISAIAYGIYLVSPSPETKI